MPLEGNSAHLCAQLAVGTWRYSVARGAEARLRLCPTCLDTLKEAVSAATWDSPWSSGLVSLRVPLSSDSS